MQVYLIAQISDAVQTRVVVDESQWDDERRQPAQLQPHAAPIPAAG